MSNHSCTRCNRTFTSGVDLVWHSTFTTPCVRPVPFDEMNRQEISHLREQLKQAQAEIVTLKASIAAGNEIGALYEKYVKDLSKDLQCHKLYKTMHVTYPEGSSISPGQFVTCPVFLLINDRHLVHNEENNPDGSIVCIKVYYDIGATSSDEEYAATRSRYFTGVNVLKIGVATIRLTDVNKNGTYSSTNNMTLISISSVKKLIATASHLWIHIPRANIDALWDIIITTVVRDTAAAW